LNKGIKVVMTTSTHPNQEFVLFYDGQCPICQKEVKWLRGKNKQGLLVFQNINETGFDASIYGKTHDDLMAEIHGVYADGRIIKGIDVFYVVYNLVGLGWLMAPMRWPWLKPFFKGLYGLFARNRLKLGRLLTKQTCDQNNCRI
jgi:predicted DCC family thiol-disulfide oxidoreductase YuxK